MEQKMSQQPEATRSPFLDGWRGFAIAAVLEGHFAGLIPARTGRMGVDAFFALSGFLMAGLLFIQQQPLSTFYKRRISRIAPVFLVFVVVVHLLALALDWSFTKEEFIATLLFARTYVPSVPFIIQSAVPIQHLWSLNVEEHAYIFMSGFRILSVLRRNADRFLLLVGFSAIAIGFSYQFWHEFSPQWREKGTEEAWAPLMLAAGYRLWRHRRPTPELPWLSAVATLLAVAPYFSAAASLPKMVQMGLYYGSPIWFAIAVNHLGESKGLLRRAMDNEMLQKVGLWSYSIYLWQQPFYQHKFVFPGGAPTALACALAVSLASYYWLEKPSRTWLNARW
jgi:peptidoglycan/LPS O-acetylase OafA/YrhL